MVTSRFRLAFQPPPAVREAAFAHEAHIFETTYGVSYDEHVLEFAPYESATAFLVVLTATDEVVATMRLIRSGPAGLKTLVEAAGPPWGIEAMRAAGAVGVDPERTWDVATLGAGRGLGRDRFAVTAALYHGLTLAARRNGIRSLLMTVDERVRTILQNFGLFTTALPGAKPGPFCGSPASTPVYGHCSQMLAMQRRMNPEAYRLVTRGVGLGDVFVPPVEYFGLRDAAGDETSAEPLQAALPVPA